MTGSGVPSPTSHLLHSSRTAWQGAGLTRLPLPPTAALATWLPPTWARALCLWPHARAGSRGFLRRRHAFSGAEKWPAPPPEAVNHTLSSPCERRGLPAAQLGRRSVFTSQIGSVKQDGASRSCDPNSLNAGNLETPERALGFAGAASHPPIFFSDFLLVKRPNFLGANRELALRIKLFCITRGPSD